ncbi:MAG: hypothetical protein JXB60_01485, partial [Candidatus Cloacimonetes bacterium]|nr:hypothetical protein [Candidatus Cloacimonadota bacterium]
MNRSAVIIFILLLPFLIFPYQWDPIGPSGIETYDYHSLYQVICTSNGIMLYEDEQWNEYSYGNLPVRGAMEPENVDSNVILVMGQGTDSDGVYMFNLSTHNFTVMYWILNPHFIFRCYDNEKFYAGGEEGLLVSEDGTVWFPIPFFAGKDCLAIAARNDYLVVSAADDIYFSPDNGNQWFPAEAWLWISDMAYHPGGNLYGIFPDGSFSSGLWCSSNNGDDWDVEFWDLNLSSVFLDQESNIFVAWEESAAGQGVAIWHADIMELEYFNDDLPDLHVNNLTYDPYIDCNNVIACTDGGIFMLTG